MGSDKGAGKAPHIEEVLKVAQTLGVKRNGESTSDFAKRVIETAILKCRVDQAWKLRHQEVANFGSKFSRFDPAENGTHVGFEEPDEPNTEYLKSQISSYIRELT